MKLAFVSVLTIFGLTSNLTLGWTDSLSQVIAGLPPPPDTGTPDGQRTPGGTRPEQTVACKQTNQPLTALVPKNSKGFTTSEYPSFWFYIPYAPQDIHSIEFSLHNREETTTLYRTSVQLTKTPGVIAISLPPNSANSLKLNQTYHWYLTVNCNSKEKPENDIVLDGWVTRVEQSSNFVIWYDDLTNLAKRFLFEQKNTAVKKNWE